MGNYSYQIITIDISSGITDFEIDIEGQVLSYLIGITNLTIRLDERSNHAIPFKSKDSLTLPAPISFKSLFITAAAYAETITLMVAKPSGMHLQSQKFDLENISGEISDLRNRNVLRSPITDLSNATHVFGSGAATTTLVAAGTNTDGMIIRLAQTWCDGAGGSKLYCSPTNNVNIICGSYGASGPKKSPNVINLLIGAGLPLNYNGNHASSVGFAWYELL